MVVTGERRRRIQALVVPDERTWTVHGLDPAMLGIEPGFEPRAWRRLFAPDRMPEQLRSALSAYESSYRQGPPRIITRCPPRAGQRSRLATDVATVMLDETTSTAQAGMVTARTATVSTVTATLSTASASIRTITATMSTATASTGDVAATPSTGTAATTTTTT